MANQEAMAQVSAMEERLCEAMLASDVNELDHLISEQLAFIGPDGQIYGKQDDLEMHRKGASRFTQIERTRTQIVMHGEVAIAIVDAKLEGVFKNEAFVSQVRYLRTWQKHEKGWKIIAGSVSALH
jgi:ketosteroid isomerase-like protein